MKPDLKDIEKIWGLSGVSEEKIFKQNEERFVVLINSNKGRFVYKMVSPWKDTNALQKDTAIFDVLRSNGSPYISKILKTTEAENFSMINNRLVYLYEYIEGGNPLETIETFKKLAEITADLHSTNNYPYKTDFDPKYIAEHNFIDNAKKFSFVEEYLSIGKTLPDFSKLTQVLIHTDISPKNSIQQKDGSLVLIDWDDVGIGPLVLDLGYILGHFVTEKFELKTDLARAFFETYFSKITITQEDKKAIFDACLFFHLMYIIFGDINQRWQKIKWLVANRELVESLIP